MMLNCELKVEYEGRVIDVPTGSNLSDFLKSEENDQLYCAKFLEPIIVNDEPLSIVHFTDLLFLASSIIFFAKEYPFKIQLRSQSSLNLKIIKPGNHINSILFFIISFFKSLFRKFML